MSSKKRLTVRQTDELERRRRMTQQRQELTHRIRKQKKTEYLARKRHYAITPPANPSPSSEIHEIQPLIQDFCSKPTIDLLQRLHDALQKATLEPTEDNWLVVLPSDDLSSASSLIGHMQGVASAPVGLSLALNILVRLTSISYIPPTGSVYQIYYGKTPISWATLVSSNVAWLTQLVQLAPQCETACVVLGNLVGEANGQTFQKLREAGMIPALLAKVHHPSAAWALTNAIRHDTAVCAGEYCNDNALSPTLLEQLLKEEPVATQAAWMLASLTNREPEVVQYIMGHASFATTMMECIKHPVCRDQLAPLVQALGNIATCSTVEGPPFSTSLVSSLPMLTPMIGQLLQIPTNREVVYQACWLAGSVLLDAGISNHPATTIAAPKLLPILFQELRESTPHSLTNQRELLQALWNALTVPDYGGDVSAAPIPLPSWELVRPAMFTIVRLAGSADADASMAAVSILELLLDQHVRQAEDHDRLKIALHENDVTSVLEKLCDSQCNEELAEVAANLLDNHFYTDDEDLLMDAHPITPSKVMPDGTYAFGLHATMNGREDMQRGMGRGKEATLPAWMHPN